MRTGALVLPLIVAGSAVAGGVACDVSVNDTGVSLGVAKGRAQDQWARTYTLGPGGRLEIHNVNGSIDVTPADATQVEVRADRIASAISDDAARGLLRSLRMSEDVAA